MKTVKRIKQVADRLFRCACGGWVIRDRSASYNYGFRADSCECCNRIQ